MSEAPRKRSRFDQTEPEPRRPTRFDRRSRSPSSKDADSHRSRSPIGRNTNSPGNVEKKDPKASALAAAARISANLHKGSPQHEPPSVQSPSSMGAAKSPGGASIPLNGDIYQQDGDYIKDIEINDLRNRYTLTKGATQKMIKEETGADITTRGNYYPDKSMATPSNPPLYLHLTSQSREGLEKAHEKISELMKQELPNLVDERRFRRREPEQQQQQVERDEHGRRKWPEERIPVDLEPIPGFNLRAQVVGHGGAYVKHIQGETRCRVQIKGRGSGFTERDTQMESDEPMYLHVVGPDANDVQNAKSLCEDLLSNVREQYDSFKARPQRHSHGGYHQHHGQRGGGGDHGNQGYGHHQSGYGGYGGGYGGGARSPGGNNPMSPGAQGQQPDYAAQWAQYYAQQGGQGGQGGEDPYAAYGGLENYTKMYYAWMQQQQGQGQEQDPAATQQGYPGGFDQWQQQGPHQYSQQGAEGYGGQAPPPPPSDGNAPPGPPGGSPPPPPPGEGGQAPPPPPGGSPPGTGGYGAVPPPPGL